MMPRSLKSWAGRSFSKAGRIATAMVWGNPESNEDSYSVEASADEGDWRFWLDGELPWIPTEEGTCEPVKKAKPTKSRKGSNQRTPEQNAKSRASLIAHWEAKKQRAAGLDGS